MNSLLVYAPQNTRDTKNREITGVLFRKFNVEDRFIKFTKYLCIFLIFLKFEK